MRGVIFVSVCAIILIVLAIAGTIGLYLQPNIAPTVELTPLATPVATVTRIAPASYEYHLVARGDTLTTISYQYGSTVEALVEANGLPDKNRIAVGQLLKVPLVALSIAQSSMQSADLICTATPAPTARACNTCYTDRLCTTTGQWECGYYEALATVAECLGEGDYKAILNRCYPDQYAAPGKKKVAVKSSSASPPEPTAVAPTVLPLVVTSIPPTAVSPTKRYRPPNERTPAPTRIPPTAQPTAEPTAVPPTPEPTEVPPTKRYRPEPTATMGMGVGD